MELQDYLRSLQECPDIIVHTDDGQPISLLTADFGIYDNFPVLLDTPAEQAVHHFVQEHFRFRTLEHGIWHLDHQGGIIEVQLMSGVERAVIPAFYSPVHHHFQLENFQTGVMMHPYLDRAVQEPHRSRALADVLSQIIMLAQRNAIPLCLPKSRGEHHLYEPDRTIYSHGREPQVRSA